MRINSLAVGFLASRFLLGALASPVSSPIGQEDWKFSSPGYLVPVDTPEEQFDVNAPWMTPVIDSINRDANETIFDDDGFDLVPRRAAALEAEQSLVARAENTRIWLGRNLADVGCGETIDSIRHALGQAVYSLCTMGMCDAGEGVKYVRKIDWMENGKRRTSRWLEITTMGVYTGEATLGNIHNAVKASVQRESVKFAWRSITFPTENWVHEERCKMAKFPNYIRIDKPSPNKVDVQFWLKLNTVTADCLTEEILATVGGAIHGLLGGAFGAIKMLCSSQG